jgi:molybdopterin-guanine dinucleotide biosynthesis protein A
LSLPHPALPTTADAFVLAGGRSSRMGNDKALVALAGKPLIHHALDILREAGLDPQIAGARSDFSSLAPILHDDPTASGQGPLSGICTALASGRADIAVFLPVDLPLLPPGLVAYLVRHADTSQSAVTLVSVSSFVQTFPVVIGREALPLLQARLHSDDRNCLKAFREASRILSKPFTVLPVELLLQSGQISHSDDFPPAVWFLNLNSPRDLARAETLFAGKQLQVS